MTKYDLYNLLIDLDQEFGEYITRFDCSHSEKYGYALSFDCISKRSQEILSSPKFQSILETYHYQISHCINQGDSVAGVEECVCILMQANS